MIFQLCTETSSFTFYFIDLDNALTDSAKNGEIQVKKKKKRLFFKVIISDEAFCFFCAEVLSFSVMSYAAMLLPSLTCSPQGETTDSAKVKNVEGGKKKKNPLCKVHCCSALISSVSDRWN